MSATTPLNPAITFDTLAYSKKLIEAGFTQKQAEVQAETLAEIIDQNMATKRDLLELRKELQSDMKSLEYRLTIKMGSLIAASIAIIVALTKLL